jgi:hypothetical protein
MRIHSDGSARPFVLVWLDGPHLMDTSQFMECVANGETMGTLLVPVPAEYMGLSESHVELLVLGALSKQVSMVNALQKARANGDSEAIARKVASLANVLSRTLPLTGRHDELIYELMLETHTPNRDPFAAQVDALLASVVDKGGLEE